MIRFDLKKDNDVAVLGGHAYVDGHYFDLAELKDALLAIEKRFGLNSVASSLKGFLDDIPVARFANGDTTNWRELAKSDDVVTRILVARNGRELKTLSMDSNCFVRYHLSSHMNAVTQRNLENNTHSSIGLTLLDILGYSACEV